VGLEDRSDNDVDQLPVNVVLLLQDLDLGGTQRYALSLLRHLDRSRFSPQLWVLRGGTGPAFQTRACNARIVQLSNARRVGPFAVLRLASRLVRHRPDILYTLTVVPNIWGRMLGGAAGVPVVVSGYRSLLPRQKERWLWPLSRRIICNARILERIMVRRFRVDPTRIAVIPNAVDTGLFFPREEEKTAFPSFLYAGRMVREKDPLSLLRAFHIVSGRHPDARLTMIGDGPLRPKVQKAVRSLSLQSRVACLPGTGEILPRLRKAWIFTLPSRSEASPHVVMEAMAAGLPVVATRVGGVPELIEDGRTGLLLRPGRPTELASAMEELLIDGRKRREMGFNARREMLSRPTPEEMVRKTEAVFMEALDEVFRSS